MSARTPLRPAVARHGWAQALGTVLAGLVAMGVVAALGLWAAGAGDLPVGAFPRVVTATVVTAVGGVLEVTGNADALVGTDAALSVLPLSVTLTGALVIGWGFLRPLRHRAVAGAEELAALRDALRQALTREGLWRGPARFEPHVTLIWDRRSVPTSRLDEPIGWMVEDFVLLRTIMGEGRQMEIGRWPLRE